MKKIIFSSILISALSIGIVGCKDSGGVSKELKDDSKQSDKEVLNHYSYDYLIGKSIHGVAYQNTEDGGKELYLPYGNKLNLNIYFCSKEFSFNELSFVDLNNDVVVYKEIAVGKFNISDNNIYLEKNEGYFVDSNSDNKIEVNEYLGFAEFENSKVYDLSLKVKGIYNSDDICKDLLNPKPIKIPGPIDVP